MTENKMKLNNYIEKGLTKDGISKEEFWNGFEINKIGYFLKELRISNGITKEELAKRTATTKSVISRIENHPENINLSTLRKITKALGRKVKITIL